MADQPPKPDNGEDAPVVPDRGAITGISRWQKVIGIIGLLVLLWVGMRIFGQLAGGGHGPGGMRHGPDQHAPPGQIQEREK